MLIPRSLKLQRRAAALWRNWQCARVARRLPVLTRTEFRALEAKDRYWQGRWGYLSTAIWWMGDGPTGAVLEIGPYKEPLLKTADVLDVRPYAGAGRITYAWDASKTPWPIPDGRYDLVIALQVWEHLGDQQRAAFAEVRRIARRAILSFPYKWHCPGDCHHGIDDAVIADWTLHFAPTRTKLVEKRMLYLFAFP
jgi:hypothetical protein